MKRRSFVGALAALVAAPKALLGIARKSPDEIRVRYLVNTDPVIGSKITPAVFDGGFVVERRDGSVWTPVPPAEQQRLVDELYRDLNPRPRSRTSIQ
jgi:hypothetical protein